MTRRTRRIWVLGGLAAASGLALGAFIIESSLPPRAAYWQEIKWPFARDAWPAGRAFRCASATCIEGTELYLRPKIGFCNCTTGVADDDEVDRVADLDLLSERFEPMEGGSQIRIADMPGRARRYRLRMADGSTRVAIAFAVARGCDVVVGVAQGRSTGLEPQAALELVSSNSVISWLDGLLGGGGR